MIELLKSPWPWYVTGPLIGLMVPILLLLGGKQFGVSSNLRHLCAMCAPPVEFFQYDWKKDIWNLLTLVGVVIGAFAAHYFSVDTLDINPQTFAELKQEGLTNTSGIGPAEIFSWSQLFTLRSWIFIAVGGFLVGFGSRYGDGCTSGHAIMGLSMLNWPSLVAIIGFFIGGLAITHLLYPFLLSL